MKRLLVTTLALMVTFSLSWAQQDRQQQDRMNQNTRQQSRTQDTPTSPKVRAHGYGYTGSGAGQCQCPMHSQGMGMMGMHDGMNGSSGMGMPGGQTMGGGHGNMTGMLDFLDPMGFNTSLMMIYHSDVLNLSNQQVQELEDMYVQNQNESIDAWADLAKARLQLNRVLINGQASEQQVTKAINDVTSGMADFLSMKYRHRQDVYSVLSPDQRQEFENFREMQFGQMDQPSGMNSMNRMNGQSNGYHSNGDKNERQQSDSDR